MQSMLVEHILIFNVLLRVNKLKDAKLGTEINIMDGATSPLWMIASNQTLIMFGARTVIKVSIVVIVLCL